MIPAPLPRTVDWVGDHAVLIDQTLLPDALVLIEVRDVDTMIDAIKRLAVRGAPAIGVAGALGVAVAALAAGREGHDTSWVHEQADRLAVARPTAVNLAWAINEMRPHIDGGEAAVVTAAVALLEDDIVTQRALGLRGADLVSELCGESIAARNGVRIHTHCNAGGLACVEWGTALGIVRALHELGRVIEVLVDETRPLLQGARLTAFELRAMGIPHRVLVDGAGASAIRLGLVDCVIIGADRIAANGDTANKVGSYPLALAAARRGIPFIVAAPESTLDPATPDGDAIHIEERSADEVHFAGGKRVTPLGSGAWNPAFDVTPADLITAIVTNERVIRPAKGERL
jgi:methylthioribose-1-phosphate isomerase